MVFKKITNIILVGIFCVAATQTSFASHRYVASPIALPASFFEYHPGGFVVDGTTGEKLIDHSYGLARDPKGKIVAIQIGTQGDILEFHDVAEGETGHFAGAVRMGERSLAVVNFKGAAGKPDHAAWYCLPEVDDTVLVGVQGGRTVAQSFKVINLTINGKTEAVAVVAGAAENAQGQLVPAMWHGSLSNVCSSSGKFNFMELPLPSQITEQLYGNYNFLGVANTVVDDGNGGIEITGVVRTRIGDALVSWKRPPNGPVSTEIIAAYPQKELQIAQDFLLGGQDLGIVGTKLNPKTNFGPYPVALQRNFDGQWEEIILGWDGTSMATPHFMDYTPDSVMAKTLDTPGFNPFIAGGTAFIEDRIFDDEVRGTVWKGIYGFTGSDEELGHLVVGRGLDANRLIEPSKGSGAKSIKVVDYDPHSGAILSVMRYPHSGLAGGAVLSPGTSLVPEILYNNATGEATDGPDAVHHITHEVNFTSAGGASKKQEVDLTANFMDYTPDSAFLNLTINGYATFPSSYAQGCIEGPCLNVYIYDKKIGQFALVATKPVPAAGFRFDIYGIPSVIADSGILKIRLQFTAPEKRKFDIRLDQIVVQKSGASNPLQTKTGVISTSTIDF